MSSNDELCALARKYRTLLELRLDHVRTGKIAERAVLRALAREFPGALRELDSLPLEVIEERARAIEDVENGAPCEPWMKWLVAYHALVRAALFLKFRLAERGEMDAEEQLAFEASQVARIEVSKGFVRKILRPRRGRIVYVVLSELEERFGTPRQEIENAIRAPSRPSRPLAHCR